MSLTDRARALLRSVEDALRDRLEGVDTRGRVEVANLVTDSRNRAFAVHYQASPTRALRRVLAELELPRPAVFIDVGSGKGRALLEAARLPFARLIGVEFSPPLCEIARRNLARAPMPVEIVCVDAVGYEWPDDANVVYMFNPFDDRVLAGMLANLRASLLRAPRMGWLVYHFPRWHALLDECDVLARSGVRRIGRDEFALYRFSMPAAAGTHHQSQAEAGPVATRPE